MLPFNECVEDELTQAAAPDAGDYLTQLLNTPLDGDQANNELRFQDTNAKSHHVKESKSTEKVKLMKQLMRKYKTTDCMEILKKIFNNGDQSELNQWRSLNLNLTPMAAQIKTQATVEIRIEKAFANKTYLT